MSGVFFSPQGGEVVFLFFPGLRCLEVVFSPRVGGGVVVIFLFFRVLGGEWVSGGVFSPGLGEGLFVFFFPGFGGGGGVEVSGGCFFPQGWGRGCVFPFFLRVLGGGGGVRCLEDVFPQGWGRGCLRCLELFCSSFSSREGLLLFIVFFAGLAEGLGFSRVSGGASVCCQGRCFQHMLSTTIASASFWFPSMGPRGWLSNFAQPCTCHIGRACTCVRLKQGLIKQQNGA